MVSSYVYTFFLCVCLLQNYTGLAAQEFPVVKVSASKTAMYRTILAKHKDMVAFIEYTLVQNGLPKMMRNLALIESSFDKRTVSTAKAVGVWQFMEEHAADYGLKSEDRYDVYHSTQTAMKSLKNLYAKYGNWITVVAAYNCGEGNVAKAMAKANANHYDRFYMYLPRETIRHVDKFIEACAATGELSFLIADYKKSAFKQNPEISVKAEIAADLMLASTAINSAYSLAIIAEEMAIQRTDLEKWNPKVAEELLTKGTSTLYLPIDKMPDFIIRQHSILIRSIQKLNDHD